MDIKSINDQLAAREASSISENDKHLLEENNPHCGFRCKYHERFEKSRASALIVLGIFIFMAALIISLAIWFKKFG